MNKRLDDAPGSFFLYIHEHSPFSCESECLQPERQMRSRVNEIHKDLSTHETMAQQRYKMLERYISQQPNQRQRKKNKCLLSIFFKAVYLMTFGRALSCAIVSAGPVFCN